jgi:hypothetical protein
MQRPSHSVWTVAPEKYRLWVLAMSTGDQAS